MDKRGLWRTILLASVGSAIEFYDFVIFAVFARSIARDFFPTDDPFVSILATYALFAASFLVRPVGGVILSFYGDKYGRRPVFMISLLCMSGCAIAMGLLPSYGTAGAAASVAFIVLRLVQSGCFGGEAGSAVAYVVEIAPRRAGTACGILFGVLGSGVILAGLVNTGLAAVLSPALFATYGWRLAFILGGMFGLLGYGLRGAMAESPAFERARSLATVVRLRDLFRDHYRGLLVGFGVCAATAVCNGFLFTYFAGYLSGTAGLSPLQIAPILTAATVVLCVLTPVIGWLSDRTSWIWLHRIGCVLLIALGWPLLSGLSAHPTAATALTLVMVLTLCAALVNGTFAQLLATLFPTRVRAAGVTTAYNIAMTLFQGLTPLVATLLLRSTEIPAAPAAWLVGAAGVSLAFGLFYANRDPALGRAPFGPGPAVDLPTPV